MTGDDLNGLFVIVLIAAFLLAIPGTILGLKQKAIVYNGKFDLVLSFIFPVLLIIGFPDYGFDHSVSWTLKAASIPILAYSVRKTHTANPNVVHTILVVPTKYVLAVLLSIFGLLAVGGVLGGIKAIQKKDRKEAAEQFAVGAAGAAGFHYLKKLIGLLLVPEGTIIMNGYKVTVGKLPSGLFRLWINETEGTKTYPDAQTARLSAVETVKKMKEKVKQRTTREKSTG